MNFELFWREFPRKVAKAHAVKMWDRLTEEEQAMALKAIKEHILMWRNERRKPEMIPHAGTYLNGRRWEDEYGMPERETEPSVCQGHECPICGDYSCPDPVACGLSFSLLCPDCVRKRKEGRN